MSGLLIGVGLTSIATSPVAAQDEWPDSCAASEIPELTPGQYSGMFAPGDWDVFVIPEMREDEYVTIQLNATVPVVVNATEGARFTNAEGGNFENRSKELSLDYDDQLRTPSGSSAFRVYAGASGALCIGMLAEEERAGEWSLSWARAGDEPVNATQGGNVTVTEEISQLRAELAELERRADAVAARIDELQARLNQTTDEGGIVTGNETGPGNDTGIAVGNTSTNRTTTTTTGANATAARTVTPQLRGAREEVGRHG